MFCVLLTKEYRDRQKRQKASLEIIMDAKWNDIIDRFSVRVALLAVGFAVWLAISYGVLAA